MPQKRQTRHVSVQHRAAQKYRLLGYEVEENPRDALLPEFMEGITPDILARSKLDNVVVEIKERLNLKGSNNLVEMAQRISEHPDWRFELIVLPDERDQARSTIVSDNYDNLLKKVELAANAHLPEVAFIYLANVMVGRGRDLANRRNLKTKGKTDRDVFSDLSFRGVLPETMIEECLSVISTKDEVAHAFDDTVKPSYADLRRLLQLCRRLEELS